MNLNNPPKFYGILVAMLCLSIVFAMGTLSESGYIGLMGLLVGYLVGNGIAAQRGEQSETVFAESERHRHRNDPPAEPELTAAELSEIRRREYAAEVAAARENQPEG